MANKNPNTKGLKPWKKGQSGNPKGKMPTKAIQDVFKEFLHDVARSKDGQQMERLEALLKAQFAVASKGNTKAAEFLMDRAYGKPTQRNELTGKDGQPMEIEVKTLNEVLESIVKGE